MTCNPPCADEVGLGALLAVLGDHLELGDLVRIELEDLEEVVEEVPDEELVLGEAVAGGRDVGAVGAEVAAPLQAAQQHHGEHGAVEDVAKLALAVVRHQVVEVSARVGTGWSIRILPRSEIRSCGSFSFLGEIQLDHRDHVHMFLSCSCRINFN